MIKRLLSLFILLLNLPVFAGELEDALKNNSKIYLYLYTNNCKYCDRFKPTSEKLEQKYKKDCAIVKVDATTKYGNSLMQEFGCYYVPNLVLLDYKKQTMKRVTPNCMLNYDCIKDAMEEFVKQ